MPNIEKIIRQYHFQVFSLADPNNIHIDVYQPLVPGRIFGFKITIKGTYDANASFENDMGMLGVHVEPFSFNWALVKYNPLENLGLNEPWGFSADPERSFIATPKFVILGGQFVGTLVNPHNTTYVIPQTDITTEVSAATLDINALLVGTVTDFDTVPGTSAIGTTSGLIILPEIIIEKINLPTKPDPNLAVARKGCIFKKISEEEKSRTGRMLALNEIVALNINCTRANHAGICIFVQFFFEKQ